MTSSSTRTDDDPPLRPAHPWAPVYAFLAVLAVGALAIGVALWPGGDDDDPPRAAGPIRGEVAGALLPDTGSRAPSATAEPAGKRSPIKKAPDPCDLLRRFLPEDVSHSPSRHEGKYFSAEWRTCEQWPYKVSVLAVPASPGGKAESAAASQYLSDYSSYRNFGWFLSSVKPHNTFCGALRKPGDQAFTCYAAADFGKHETSGGVLEFRARNVLVTVDYGAAEDDRNLALNNVYKAALKVAAHL